MKKIYIIVFLLVASFSFSQVAAEDAEAKKKQLEAERALLPKPYNESEDAEVKVSELLLKAKAENKNVLMQVGGNWCIWCLRLNKFIQDNDELKQLADNNYVYYHLNWSPKNKNEKFFKKYKNPGEKKGYPVFMILNPKGKLIHVQETGSLEEGKGYSKEKVQTFLEAWKRK